MIRPLLTVALCLLPAVARAGDPTSTTGDSDSESEADSGSETATMPPVYEPCGCRSDQLGGGWTLALATLALLTLRPRRRR